MSTKPKSKAGRRKPPPWPVMVTVRGAVISCTSAVELEGGRWVLLLTAVARQCNVHRTVIRRAELTPEQARRLIVRWARTLPLDDLA